MVRECEPTEAKMLHSIICGLLSGLLSSLFFLFNPFFLNEWQEQLKDSHFQMCKPTESDLGEVSGLITAD